MERRKRTRSETTAAKDTLFIRVGGEEKKLRPPSRDLFRDLFPERPLLHRMEETSAALEGLHFGHRPS